jgi:branched-chain amino acid transport system substrate-binding protein
MKTTRPWIAAAAASALLLSGCAGAGEDTASGEDGDGPDLDVAPGVTDDSVVIGTHQPLTGPAAPGYSTISVGAQAVYDFINDNGGVHGREIEYIVEDDVYDPTNTVEVTQELIHHDDIFAMVGGLGTPTHSTVIETLNDEGVPDLFVSSGALMWNQPDEFPMSHGYQPDYEREAKIMGEYIAEEFPDADVAYLAQGDDVGTDSQVGLDLFLEDQVVANETYEPGQDSISAQMEAIAAEDPDVVTCYCTPTYSAMMILETQRIDLDAELFVASIGGDTVTLAGLLQEFTEDDVPAEALMAGMYTADYLPAAVDMDDPWTEFFYGLIEEYAPEDAVFSNTTIYGMVQAVMFAQLLHATGEDLTRQTLMDTLAEEELLSPGMVPFVTDPDDHAGFSGIGVMQIDEEGFPNVVQEPRVTGWGDAPIEEVDHERPDPEDVEPLASIL